MNRRTMKRVTASRGPTASVALILLAAALAPGAARAQDASAARDTPARQETSPPQDGILSGTITDTTGFVLPGVTVEVRSTSGAGPARTVVSDGAGRFTLAALPPVMYNVTFTLPGFGVDVRRGVAIAAAAAVALDVTLAAQFEERVVVVGSRARPRSVIESTVPIDAIPYQDVVSQGSTDVSDQLRTLFPSYNVNPQPVGDAARLIRPANLRGLAPDDTLVLVNGKRRHRGAIIAWIGNGVSDGAQGPDISTIPAIALRQIEVLRDGAAAQYGSDAIAGVLNFLLKDDSSGGSLELHTGGYGAGDGGAYTVAGNAGLPLGRTGFANLSVEYGNSAATSRSVQRDDAALLIAAGNEAVADPAQIWGSPRVEDNVKLWGNFGYLFAGGVQAYGHANYASRRVASGFFFRNPNTRAAVFSADRGQSLLIGDTLDAQDGVLNRSAGCPVVPVTAGRPDQAALGRVFADPNCFSFQERFAGGFTPQFGGDVLDTSLVAGLRGQLTGGVLWDASATAGTSEADFFIEDTVNASLGPATPTTFDPGLYRQDEIGLNVDLGYPLNDKDPPGRRRRVAGRALHDRPGRRAVVADRAVRPARLQRRVQRLPRLQPHSRRGLEPRQRRALRRRRGAGRGRRLDPGQRTPPGGLRGLRHDDERQALRPVPTHWRRRPARQREQRLPRADPRPAERLQRLDRVRPRADGPGQQRHHPLHLAGAALRGGEPLQPERAVSYALGAVVDAGPFSLTADYFRIRLADRLALTQLFALSPTEVEGLLTEGVTSARNLQNFRFFTNHFETRTQGLDLVATYRPPSLGGRTTFGFLFNRTATAVTGSDPTVLDALRVRELQEAIPGTRWNATVRHEIGPWRLLGRFSYYDEWFDSRDLYVYHGDSVFDLEAAYTVSESTTLTIGGQNVFGNDPEANPIARAKGNRFSVQTPFGANGGFYYVRINYGWTAGG